MPVDQLVDPAGVLGDALHEPDGVLGDGRVAARHLLGELVGPAAAAQVGRVEDVDGLGFRSYESVW